MGLCIFYCYPGDSVEVTQRLRFKGRWPGNGATYRAYPFSYEQHKWCTEARSQTSVVNKSTHLPLLFARSAFPTCRIGTLAPQRHWLQHLLAFRLVTFIVSIFLTSWKEISRTTQFYLYTSNSCFWTVVCVVFLILCPPPPAPCKSPGCLVLDQGFWGLLLGLSVKCYIECHAAFKCFIC